MRNLTYLTICSLFLLNPCLSSFSQDLFSDNNPGNWPALFQSAVNTYGLDQVLLNGECFEEYYLGSIGHPFLFEDQFFKGTLVFRSRTYKDVNLKYDIYKQQIVLYVTQNNTNLWIIPPNEFISSFSMGNLLFKKFEFQGLSKFYQVIFDSENLKCLYYWSKIRFDSDHQKDYSSSRFTDSDKKTYLVIGNVLKKYNDNQSFVNLFPHECQLQIKQYIKDNSIKVSKSNEFEIARLLSYCETLL